MKIRRKLKEEGSERIERRGKKNKKERKENDEKRKEESKMKKTIRVKQKKKNEFMEDILANWPRVSSFFFVNIDI